MFAILISLENVYQEEFHYFCVAKGLIQEELFRKFKILIKIHQNISEIMTQPDRIWFSGTKVKERLEDKMV